MFVFNNYNFYFCRKYIGFYGGLLGLACKGSPCGNTIKPRMIKQQPHSGETL